LLAPWCLLRSTQVSTDTPNKDAILSQAAAATHGIIEADCIGTALFQKVPATGKHPPASTRSSKRR
jgi:hypothetical protein